MARAPFSRALPISASQVKSLEVAVIFANFLLQISKFRNLRSQVQFWLRATNASSQSRPRIRLSHRALYARGGPSAVLHVGLASAASATSATSAIALATVARTLVDSLSCNGAIAHASAAALPLAATNFRRASRKASTLFVPARPLAVAAVATATIAVAATAALATAASAVSPAAVSSRAQPLSAQPLSAQPLSRRTEHLLHHHLRPLHRRSQLPELHSLAQLSVELRQQRDVRHHADRARHWNAPNSNLLRC